MAEDGYDAYGNPKFVQNRPNNSFLEQAMDEEVMPKINNTLLAAQIEQAQVETGARSFMLPGVVPPMLLNLNGTSTRSHPLCLADEQPINWNSNLYPEYNQALQHLQNTDMLIFTLRDPSCENIVYDPALTNNRTVVYDWIYSAGGTPSQYDFPLARGDSGVLRTSGMTFNGDLGNRATHGPFCIARGFTDSPEFRANYLDGLTTTDDLSTSKIAVSLIPQSSGATPINGGCIALYKSNYGAFDLVDSIDIQAGVFDYVLPVTESNYYAVKVILDGQQTGSFTAQVTQTNVCSSFSHVPAPFFYDNENSTLSFMTQSCSTLWHNVASPLNKQGTLWALQAPPGSNWLQYIANASTSPGSFLAKQDGFVVNGFEFGSYMWTKPNGTNDFAWRQFFRFANDNSTNIETSPIDMVAPIKQDCVGVQTATVSDPQGCDSYIRRGLNGQLQTLNKYFTSKMPSISEEVTNEIVSVTRKLTNIMTNLTHTKTIDQNLAEVGRNAFSNWFGKEWAPVGENLGDLGGKLLGGLGRHMGWF